MTGTITGASIATNMPHVSVIIPTYNRASYLPESLRSVFAQTLPPTEVIVVDDGSTDDTAQVMRDWAARIRYDRQEHRGVSAARNRGLELATGEVIAWLDADDLWEPDFLETLVSLLARRPELDGVYCGLKHVDTSGKLLSTPNQRVVPPEDLYSALIEADFIVTPALLVYKRCYDQVGSFDPQFDICEDYDMWLRLARVFTIAGIPQPLVRIRVHASSTIMQDSSALRKFRLALTQKHFGTYEGDPASWPLDKRRAHAHAIFYCSLLYMQDGKAEEGWRTFREAVATWPGLLNRLDTFYELACGDQARGYRGQADRMDIEKNGAEMLGRLQALFDTVPALHSMRGKAYGNAYLALGMLSDQAGRWNQARGYLYRAIRFDPRLLTVPAFIRRLLKLWSGKRLTRLGRTLVGAS